MSRQTTNIFKELSFTGGRFEQNKGWLDIDILAELQAYKKLLIQMAKEEWKRKNPERERLPAGFEENICLGFHEVKPGSCIVPLERVMTVESDTLFDYVPDEVDEAASIIDKALLALREDRQLPENFPVSSIPVFLEWGKSLKSDEAILLGNRNNNSPKLDASIRDRLSGRKTGRYEDIINLTGEIRSAELKARQGGTFTIQLENGESVIGVFNNEQEGKITEALYKHDQLRLKIFGKGEFEQSGRLNKIVKIDRIEECQPGDIPYNSEAPPVWEMVENLGKSVPTEEWDKVPSDLAANLDHYLYGDKKESRK